MYTTSFVEIALSELLMRVQTLKHDGVRFVQMCAEKNAQDDIDLVYTFYDENIEAAVNLIVPIAPGDKVPSIQELYFAAFSYENETHDLYGVRFANMKLDFGGHFFNLAETAPMTVISPEQRAAREKAAKLKAAQEAKAAKAAAARREAAEAAAADRALNTSAAEADAAAVAAVNAAAPAAARAAAPASVQGDAPAKPAPAAAPAAAEDRAAKMEAKLAAMDPEKAAKIRAALAAKGVKTAAAGAPAAGDSADETIKEGE